VIHADTVNGDGSGVSHQRLHNLTADVTSSGTAHPETPPRRTPAQMRGMGGETHTPARPGEQRKPPPPVIALVQPLPVGHDQHAGSHRGEEPMTAQWPPPESLKALPEGGWAWSDFAHPVYDFSRVLRAAALMPAHDDLYWEAPWKWDAHHRVWIAAGEPRPPQPGSTATLAWRRFVRDCRELPPVN